MFFLLSILFTTLFTLSHSSKTEITIYRITASTDPSTSTTAQLVQQIAIDEINNNPSILPKYKLKLHLLDSSSESEKALENAIIASQNYSQCSLQNNSSLISPIVSGPPWSAFSVLTSRVFNIYHLLQISASATSPALSEKDKYGSFFRTIANDNLQGKAIIKLCKQFEWTRIGVIYQNDNYGQNFNKVIQEEADANNIEIHSKSFISNDTDSIKTVAKFIKIQKLYITILVAQGADVSKLFQNEAFTYPYYFIGTDSWFNKGEIKQHQLTNQSIGYIGTIPGNPTMFTIDQYIKHNIYNGNMTIYYLSNSIYKRIISKLNNKTKNISLSDPMIGYGYDSMRALALALDIYDKTNNQSLKSDLTNCSKLKDVSDKLKVVLNNMSEFIGVTGPVKFKNGDRVNGTFAYGFAKNDGEIEIFGNFANEYDDNYINITQITFSDMFEQFEHLPLSNVCTESIGYGVNSHTIGIIGGFYGFICLMVFILAYYKRNDKGKLVYFSMNIGFILCFILIISYGLQKKGNAFSENNLMKYDILCLSNLVILCIAFTFTFLAFIAAQSELMRIIVKFMRKQQLGNYKGDQIIYKKLLNCLILDGVILLSFIIAYFIVYFENNIKLLDYKFIGIGEPIDHSNDDELKKIQPMYPICESHWSTNIFYAILFIYKIIQMMYSIDSAAGLMISYIILIVCIVCISLITVSWYTLNQMFLNNTIDQNIQYLILSIVIIFIYLLWIIPEYYYLCKKCLGYNTDESTTKSTTTTTPSLMDQNAIQYDHLTAAQNDNICTIETRKNKSNISGDDEKSELIKQTKEIVHNQINDIDKQELTITPMELALATSFSDGNMKNIIKTTV